MLTVNIFYILFVYCIIPCLADECNLKATHAKDDCSRGGGADLEQILDMVFLLHLKLFATFSVLSSVHVPASILVFFFVFLTNS